MAGWIAFFLYLIALVYFLLFAEMFGRTNTEKTYRYNLVLFKEIWRFWHYREILGTTAVLLNLVGNVHKNSSAIIGDTFGFQPQNK